MTGGGRQTNRRKLIRSTWTNRWRECVDGNWPEWIMDVQTPDDFHAKQGRSTGKWQTNAHGKHLSIYLKRHYRLTWQVNLLAILCPWQAWSPAFREWKNLQWAHKQGVHVPEPLVAAEFRPSFGKLQSVLAIEELHGMLPLHILIPLAAQSLAPHVFKAWKRQLVSAMVRVTRKLHDQNRFHKDLYLCHFYLPEHMAKTQATQDRSTEFFDACLHLIDFHRMGYHRWTRLFWQIKDLAQLLFSSDVQGITMRDRVLFWRLYRGSCRRTVWTRLLEFIIQFRYQRYRKHNQKLQARSVAAEVKREAA